MPRLEKGTYPKRQREGSGLGQPASLSWWKERIVDERVSPLGEVPRTRHPTLAPRAEGET